MGIFLKNLRSSTIELINKDYADFVDLSSNLVILQKSITGIETPINKIQEEILVREVKTFCLRVIILQILIGNHLIAACKNDIKRKNRQNHKSFE